MTNEYRASIWPLGLTCCFGLLLFLIVTSIILALIPIYLPYHDSDLQYQSNQSQVTYIQYSGTAVDGLTGSLSNLNDINKELNNQLGLKDNLINVENVQVIRNPDSSRRRRSLNSLSKREKRAVLSFRVLFTIRIIYPEMCRSSSCHTKISTTIARRCSEKANIVLQFLFISYTNGPIQYNLIFISFTFDIPSIFLESQSSSSSSSSSTTTTTTTTTTTSEQGQTTDFTTDQNTVTDDLIDEGNSTTSHTPNAGQCTESVSQGLKWFGSYNLITLGDLSTTSIVKNRTIICGSYTSDSSATFASEVGQLSSSLDYTFQLNGNIVGGNSIQIEKGSFGVGTNPTHNIVQPNASPVQYTLDNRQININGGNDGAKLNVDNNLSNTCQSITTSLKDLSETLSKLPDTSSNTVSIPTTQDGPLNVYVKEINSNGISVFNLDGNTILNNNHVQQIEMFIDSSISSNLKLVVINLSGTDISFGKGNLVGDWFNSVGTGQSHTIWNLNQAITLNIDKNWMGSVLAPNAHVTNSAQIDGAVAVNSLTATAGINNPSIILPTCI